MSHVAVLCVENPPSIWGALKYILETAGYKVMVATNGDQALRLLTTLEVDGVLLEYDLPDANGSAVRAFAGIGSETPFLLRFFDAYLRSPARLESDLRDLAGHGQVKGLVPGGIPVMPVSVPRLWS